MLYIVSIIKFLSIKPENGVTVKKNKKTKKQSQNTPEDGIQDDTVDIPDCYGSFTIESQLCAKYCALSIRCCLMHNRYPEVDILDRLLRYNHPAIKIH
jgi:hypothetical protein